MNHGFKLHPDGTLEITMPKGKNVGRVLVCEDGTQNGTLMYPDCDDCIKHGGDWKCNHKHCHKCDVPDINVGDMISRQDAIDALDKRFDNIPMEQTTEILLLRKDLREMLSASLNCSEFPNNSDAISRQAAIEAIHEDADWLAAQGSDWQVERMERDKSILKSLPSAEPEIIRCKDCKHWDGVDTCDVIDAPVWDNDFCSMAELRGEQDEAE